jgi:catalase (peroxidase I)
MAFHDAGTYEILPVSAFGKDVQCGGANGSFKKEFDDGTVTKFKTFPQQNGMQLCYNFLWGSKNLSSAIRAIPTCANMSFADMIQLVGYIAVVKTGGLSCPFYPGRPDDTGFDNVSHTNTHTHTHALVLTCSICPTTDQSATTREPR